MLKFLVIYSGMLQLLGDFVPQIPYRASPLDPLGTSVPQAP